MDEKRSISIGGGAEGNVFVLGNQNETRASIVLEINRGDLPPAISVNIVAQLAALRELLAPLAAGEKPLVEAAIAEAEALAKKSNPPKDQIGNALERAVGYAGGAAKLMQSGEKLWPVLKAIGGWLGEHGLKFLQLAGIAVA